MDWYLESRPLSSFSPDALWCTWFGDGTKLSAVHSNSNKNAIRLPSNHMFVIDIPRRNQRRRICAERYTLRHVIIRTIWTIRTVRAMNHGTIRNLRKRLSESFVGSCCTALQTMQRQRRQEGQEGQEVQKEEKEGHLPAAQGTGQCVCVLRGVSKESAGQTWFPACCYAILCQAFTVGALLFSYGSTTIQHNPIIGFIWPQ